MHALSFSMTICALLYWVSADYAASVESDLSALDTLFHRADVQYLLSGVEQAEVTNEICLEDVERYIASHSHTLQTNIAEHMRNSESDIMCVAHAVRKILDKQRIDGPDYQRAITLLRAMKSAAPLKLMNLVGAYLKQSNARGCMASACLDYLASMLYVQTNNVPLKNGIVEILQAAKHSPDATLRQTAYEFSIEYARRTGQPLSSLDTYETDYIWTKQYGQKAVLYLDGRPATRTDLDELIETVKSTNSDHVIRMGSISCLLSAGVITSNEASNLIIQVEQSENAGASGTPGSNLNMLLPED